MARKLRKLLIDRIDLVSAGANPDAHIVLYKAAEAPVEKEEYEDDMPPLTTAQRLEQQQLWAQWWPLWDAFTASMYELIEGCREGERATYGPLIQQSISEFHAKATDILEGLGVMKQVAPIWASFQTIAKAGRVMSGPRMAQLKTAISTLQAILREAGGEMEKGHPMAEKVDTTAELTAVLKRAEAAEAQARALEAENAALKKQLEPEPTEEDFLKAMPEAMRKRWEENERLTKEALETAKVEKEKRERREYIEKVAPYKPLGLVADDDWELLQAIDKMETKPRLRLLQVMKSCSEVLRQSSLFTSLGQHRPTQGGNAWAQAEALAAELVTKGAAKTKEQAIAKVFADNPELRQQYAAEKRGA